MLALRIVVLGLREVAPEHAALAEHDRRLEGGTGETLRRFEAVARFPGLPAAVRPLAEKLAATARLAAKLKDGSSAAQLAGLKLIYGRLGEGTRAVRSALEAGQPR